MKASRRAFSLCFFLAPLNHHPIPSPPLLSPQLPSIHSISITLKEKVLRYSFSTIYSSLPPALPPNPSPEYQLPITKSSGRQPRRDQEMRCYGVTVPGSDLTRFHYPRLAVPKLAPVFPGQVRFRPVKASGGAGIDGGLVAEAGLSFYDLLGIPLSGSLPEIKQAYKQMARKYHPDVSPPDRVEEYTQRFIRVQEAYETLSDPRRRAMYDSDMSKGLHLAFSARRPFQYDEDMEEKGEWKGRWQSQLSELKRRSTMNKSSRSSSNMSWGARMRRQREESSGGL